MIDPLERWRDYGEKPDFAGLLTFGGLPYTEDPAELEGADAAIVGAPMDELTSDAPGTRFGPRAIRAAGCASGPHLEAGIRVVVADTIAAVGSGPVFLSVDVDVLDPAFAPGTGTPEPGGMTTADLLRACRTVAASVELVGAEVVEVCPSAIGSLDVTALAAERIVREIMTGIALRRLEPPTAGA